MASILPGFEYDIFISYRHKDNEYDGWVTEFVDNLRKELRATFKEDISIYFDENPHDGLLETHHVDKSLEGKLKCLIFIPIISQTYCDPKSFAWQHEFCAFNKLAKEDQFGRDIKLSNGNVAGRILPVKIHDIDAEDKVLLENELGGALRSIEFIFKSTGVNRPLTPSDNPEKNLNKTFYRDQVNKVANTVKEIVTGLKTFARTPLKPTPPSSNWKEPQPKLHVRKLLANSSAILLLMLLAGYLIFNFTPLGTRLHPEPIAKSIAVLPFVDMSQAKDLEYLADGITEEIINSLTVINGLKISSRTSSFQFKEKNVDLKEIAEKLDVETILEGSVQKSGNRLRITVQLIRAKDNFHLWSEHFDKQTNDIFAIQDSIALNVVRRLRITLSENEIPRISHRKTTQDAYTEYLKGSYAYQQGNFGQSIEYNFRAIQQDSLFAQSYSAIALAKAWIIILRAHDFGNAVAIDEAKKYARRSIQLDPYLGEGYSALALMAWAIEGDFSTARINFEKSIQLNPSSSLIKNRYGYFLMWMGDFNKACSLALEAMKADPADYNSYMILSRSKIYSGQFAEADKYLQEGSRLFPEQGFQHQIITREFYAGNYQKLIPILESRVQQNESLDHEFAGISLHFLSQNR